MQLMNDNNGVSVKIFDHPQFYVQNFTSRWEKARISSLQNFLHDLIIEKNLQEQSSSEDLLLELVTAENKESVFRSVFDCSRKFGMNASRFFGMTFEVSDLAEILQESNIPCFLGKWRSHNSAYVLERKGCSSLSRLGSVGCDYWREALDGLVVGTGEDERLARHRSQGHGDTECVDVLFAENYTLPRIVSSESSVSEQRSSKYGPISAEIQSSFEPIQTSFHEMKVKLILEGESEGVLYYRLEAEEGVLCGAGGKLMHDSLARDVSGLFPKLTLRDAAPLAVYGGST